MILGSSVQVLRADKDTELEGKVDELERAEGARVAVLARAATLDESIHVLGSEHATEMRTATLREARLDERIGELEGEFSTLGDQVAALEVERARLLALTPPASVPRYLYKMWIHAEAQRDI